MSTLPTITQAMLEEYRRLCEATKLCKHLRSRLIKLIKAGALIEAGALTAEVKSIKLTIKEKLAKKDRKNDSDK